MTKKVKKLLQDMVVDEGLLTQKQMNKVVIRQQKTDLGLSKYLINERLISHEELADILSKQTGIKRYTKEAFPVDTTVGGYIPVEVVRKHQAVPVCLVDGITIIAMTDPMDMEALDAVQEELDNVADEIICTQEEFNYISDTQYGTYSGLGKFIDDLEAMQFGEKSVDEYKTPEDVAVKSVSIEDENAPVIKVVSWILYEAINAGASDIHISPEKDSIYLRFRVDGKLHEIKAPPRSLYLELVSRFKILAHLDITVSRLPQDGRFTVKMFENEINIRVSTIPTIRGEKLVLRLLDVNAEVFSLDDLGMSDSDQALLKQAIVNPFGMILSTGPTGSGKSTSLYSIIKEINQSDINIVTLEDPVEFRMEKICQIQLNRRAGMTFASGLRSILRQDPDVIMVGEVRDAETANVAVQAALTGHLVMTTVHTNDAAGAIDRFIDMKIEPFLISSVLLVVFAQRLVRKICVRCGAPYTPPASALKFLDISENEMGELSKGTGCMFCRQTGYKGRTGIYEVLLIDDLVADMITQRMSAREIKRLLVEKGQLSTLKHDASIKAKAGITTIEEAASVIIS